MKPQPRNTKATRFQHQCTDAGFLVSFKCEDNKPNKVLLEPWYNCRATSIMIETLDAFLAYHYVVPYEAIIKDQLSYKAKIASIIASIKMKGTTNIKRERHFTDKYTSEETYV